MYIYLVVLLFFVIYYVTKVRSSRLYEVVFQYPPCRKELPFLGSFYHFLYASSKHAMKLITDIGYQTTEAGGIARLYTFNTYYLVMTDASEIAEALTLYLNKDYMYTFLQAITSNGSVFTPEASKSKVRRRVLLPSFTSKMMAGYVESIWAESVALAESLAPFVGKGPFAAGPYLGAFCFNSILRSADAQDLRKEMCTLQLLDDFHRCLKLVYERWVSLWMYPNWVHRFTANYAETHKNFVAFQNYAETAYRIRRNKLLSNSTLNSTGDPSEEKNTKRGLFDGLLDSKLPQIDVREEIVVLMGASEEAGIALGFALMLMGQYPEVQDKLYEELRDIFDNSDRPLEIDDLKRLRYLDMVVKEVFRLYPPVPMIMRNADREIKLSSGRVVPAGAGIVVPIISLHRNPAYWGSDAYHFDPERFLPERLAVVSVNAYIPFSYGARGCVGSKYGSYLVKLALCAILRKYKVLGTPASGPIPDIEIKFEVTLKSINNFEIEFVNRI
ncbi:cytochrome P450 4c21-like [Aricia agestis]|uniref:cytochrome P450 4c21-like n=1 Tax=Aricia agestis TaxID=91739 RepID=UPI001C209054|nr:cytochrome P450 4c21-like [Aricia agestis]